MRSPTADEHAAVIERPVDVMDNGSIVAERRSAVAAEIVPVLGQSSELRRTLAEARQAAATQAAVFITGETGTGKELLARYIHSHSARRRSAFVPVNCAALPEGLFESELFGHRRGAFTGAVADKRGLLEVAHGGTIFLDELIELPRAQQAKLLRVLQDGLVRRVGSERPDAVVDVRIISATNRDPRHAIHMGELREDLLYRLEVVPLHLAALRERPEDIPLLAHHFLHLYWTRHRDDVPVPTLTPEAIWALSAHPWPGNVRELQNTMEHLAISMDACDAIGPSAIPFRRVPAHPARAVEQPSADIADGAFRKGYHAARRSAKTTFEIKYLDWFMRRAGKNYSKAARFVGIDRATLYRLLKRHGRLPRRTANGDGKVE